MFTSFVGGDAAVFGVRVRFFQRQGLDATQAISSGAIAGTASWVMKAALFVVCLPFAVGDFGHLPWSPCGQLVQASVEGLVVAVPVAPPVAVIPVNGGMEKDVLAHANGADEPITAASLSVTTSGLLALPEAATVRGVVSV
jgi:hypothetical protein